MIKRKMIFSVMMALAFLLSLTSQAFAQDPNRLASISISVWPEYDRPTVLVMMTGMFADKSITSREISVLVPAKAEVTVTTYLNPDGNFASEQQNKITDTADGFKRVSFTVSQPSFHIEYYDDSLKGSPDKTLDFASKLPAPTDQVVLEVQQPARATNFSIMPPTQPSRIDPNDSLTYYDLQFNNLAAGQTVTAQIKYTRTETRLTKDLLVSAAGPVTPSVVAEQSSVWQNAFWIAAIVILGLVAVFGFMILRQRQTSPAVMRQAARAQSKKARRAQPANGTATLFCTQCGRALRAEDNFCPRCGNKRRSV